MSDEANEFPVTLWYSTLGVGDGHDHATRGYLDALMKGGYEGLRLPPSRGTGLLALDTQAEPDLDRFTPLMQPPSAASLKPVKRIQAGDPRIGTPRKHSGSPAGDPEHGIEPLDPDKNVVAEGDVDLEAYETVEDDHGGVFTSDEAFSRNVPVMVRAIVMHHDPGSIVRHYTGIARMGRPEGVAVVGVTVWEPDRVPAAISQVLSELDMLVVPSEHTRGALDRSGLDTRCEVVPHAFDPEVWPKPEQATQTEPFAFYSIATPIARKNLKGLLTAYFRAFDADGYQGKVVLGLKTSGDKGALQTLVEEAKAAAWREPGNHRFARLKVFADRWTNDRVRMFHLAGDCYVSATRGEGFGLCEMEAALCGNRIITTDWGAAPEVLRVGGGIRHRADELPEAVGDHPYRTAGEVHVAGRHLVTPCSLVSVPTGMAEFGPYQENQKWAEPDLDALVEHMRQAWTERLSNDPEQWDALERWCSLEVIGRRLSELLHEARVEAAEEAW